MIIIEPLFGEKTFKVPIDGTALIVPIETEQSPTVAVLLYGLRFRGDAIWAPEARFENSFTKRLIFMHRKWPGMWRSTWSIFKISPIPTIRVEVIRERYEQAINEPGVVGINIGTRPDCLPDETLAYHAELTERMHVTIELGLQTTYETTSELINRPIVMISMLETVKAYSQTGAQGRDRLPFDQWPSWGDAWDDGGKCSPLCDR